MQIFTGVCGHCKKAIEVEIKTIADVEIKAVKFYNIKSNAGYMGRNPEAAVVYSKAPDYIAYPYAECAEVLRLSEKEATKMLENILCEEGTFWLEEAP